MLSLIPRMESNYSRPGSVLHGRPWLFVPILYFMQAMPNVFTGEFAQTVLKDLGVAGPDIIKWTSLIALPYSIKLFWGPLVDFNSTKRNWVLTCQLVIAALILVSALAVSTQYFFSAFLVIALVMCIFGATTDIAMDGYYLLALPREEQKRYVGIQSTFFRLGRLFTASLVPIMYEGVRWLFHLPEHSPMAWTVAILFAGAVYLAGRLILPSQLPKPEADQPFVSELAEQSTGRQIAQVIAVLMTGLSAYFVLSPIVKLSANAIAATNPIQLKGWLLPEQAFILNIPAGSGVAAEMLTLGVSSVLFVLGVVLIRKLISGTEMGHSFKTFATQKGILGIVFFCVFYRFSEAMLGGLSGLFLQTEPAKFGLGFGPGIKGSIEAVGLVGIIAGGIIGGWFLSTKTFKQASYFLILCMNIPNVLYLWASYAMPTNKFLMSGIAFVDQFGYGVGYAGYATYLQWVAQRGRYVTSHYAIATAMGATLITVAKLSGAVMLDNFNFKGAFLFALVMAIPAVGSLFLIPLPENEKA